MDTQGVGASTHAVMMKVNLLLNRDDDVSKVKLYVRRYVRGSRMSNRYVSNLRCGRLALSEYAKSITMRLRTTENKQWRASKGKNG